MTDGVGSVERLVEGVGLHGPEGLLAVVRQMSPTVRPKRASTTASLSLNGHTRRAATRRPTELLPAPIIPTSTTCCGHQLSPRARLRTEAA